MTSTGWHSSHAAALTRTTLRGAVMVVVALIAGELAVRFGTDFAHTQPAVFANSAFLPWQLKAGARAEHVGYIERFRTRIDINSRGYRDVEFAADKPDGVFRIVVVGDSFTFGYGVEADQTFPKALDSVLKARFGENYEVINAGYASGYSPDTEFVYYRQAGKALKPDLVLMAFYEANDIEDLKSTDWPERDADGLPLRVQTKRYYVDPMGRLRTATNPVKEAILDHSLLVNFAMLQYRIARRFNERLVAVPGLSPKPTKVDTSPAQLAAYAKAGRILDAFQAETGRDKTSFAVVNICNHDQLREGIPSAFLADWSTRTGGPVIDLVRELPADRADQLYFANDPHFNVQGNRVVAETIANSLVSLRLLKPPASQGAGEEPRRRP